MPKQLERQIYFHFFTVAFCSRLKKKKKIQLPKIICETNNSSQKCFQLKKKKVLQAKKNLYP